MEGFIESSIRSDFERFHARHPWVADHLEEMAESWFATGRERCSIGMLWEALRYQYGVHARPGAARTGFPNALRSRYARELMRRRPEWRGQFTTRPLVAE